MAKILSEVDEFSADVTVPEGGDPRTAASVEGPFQKLVNRTLNLYRMVRGETAFESLISRQVLIPLELGQPDIVAGDAQWVLDISTAGGRWTKVGDGNGGGIIWFPIWAPYGATIDRIEALVTANDATAMTLYLQRSAGANFITPAVPTITNVANATSPASAGLHVIDLDVNEVGIDTRASTWRATILGSGAANGDLVHALRLTFGDPGRRF